MRNRIRGLIVLIALLGLVGCGKQSAHSTHEYGEWKVTKAASCTEAGEQVRTCSCGAEEKEEIAPTGHIEVIDAATEPTCTKDGNTEGSHCSVCGEVFKEAKVIPAAHTEETVEAIAVTCTRAGKEEGKVCTVCGEVTLRQKKVRAKGHTYVNGICTKCKKVQPDTAAALMFDQFNEEAQSNFITKEAYQGGSTISFNAFVPEDVSWWAISWTTDPSKIGLYEWAEGDGKLLEVDTGKWTECTVTLPEDGKNYYIYFVGAKGEWKGKELLLDDIAITDASGNVLASADFNDGVEEGIFSVVTSNPSTKHVAVYGKEICAQHVEVVEAAVAATCTVDGKTEGIRCSSCGKAIKRQEAVLAEGHKWENRICTVCGVEQSNLSAAIKIDQLNDSAPMNFITKNAYPGGSTVSFRAYVPEGATWWAVSWTTDPSNADLYQWSTDQLGQQMVSKEGEWADYSVTLPKDGKAYYIYFVGEKGQWDGKLLQLDDIVIQNAAGKTLAEDNFDNGVKYGIFNIIETNPTTGETVISEKQMDACKNGHTIVIDAGVEPTCTETGLTEGKHCSVCYEVIKEQKEIPAKGHTWVKGKCSVCGVKKQKMALSLNIDQLNDSTKMNLITREAYPGGSTISFRAYVPAEIAGWWAVSWTTDPSDTSLYKWSEEGLGQAMTSVEGKWADYSVTLPDDGKEYYFYFVGEKGQWDGKLLQLDDVVVTSASGKKLAEDTFDNGMKSGIFTIIETNPTSGESVIAERPMDLCKNGHTKVVDKRVEPTCTETGLTQGSHCSVCGEIIKAQKEIAATGHQFKNGKCKVCGVKQENLAIAINMDQLNDSKKMNLITRKAYAGGSTVSFKAKVPEGVTGWWGVSWTTDPSDTSLYKWAEEGLGQSMTSVEGEWADYSVTLPDDGKKYYFYFVGEKGQWKGQELWLDEVVVTSASGKTLAEDNFDNGMKSGIFTIIETNPTSGETVISEKQADACANGHTKVNDKRVEPTCTETGLTKGSHCSVCGKILKAQEVIPATGHKFKNGKCTVCGEKQQNLAVSITIDQLNEKTPMNFITRETYPAGSTVSFMAYVPKGASWWAVSWTTDPSDVDLYKWAEGLGQSMTSVEGKWAKYSVTLPDDGKEYYIYFVGEKGQWKNKALQIDNVVITNASGETLAEDNFDNGMKSGIFSIVETNPSSGETVVAEQVLDECKNHMKVTEAKEEATCTESGKTEGSYCSVCGTVFATQEVIPAKGHKYDKDGICANCGEKSGIKAAIAIDFLSDSAPMNFITKNKYPEGTTISFKAYVPEGLKKDETWWAVDWTTDLSKADLYSHASGLGESKVGGGNAGKWADYTITIPDTGAGKEYYIYFAGAKGEWNEKELLIDDVVIKDASGKTIAEDNFENGIQNGIFNVVEKDGSGRTVVSEKGEKSLNKSASQYIGGAVLAGRFMLKSILLFIGINN